MQVAISVPFPDGRLVYEFVLDAARLKWVPWLERLEAAPGKPAAPVAAPDADYASIIVPTVDTLCYTRLLDALVRRQHHCLLVGATGTGKSAYVKRHLATGLCQPVGAYASMVVTFSAQTTANMTQV
jgi:dynein heavy chain